jgi:hypothetical protein
LWEATRGYERIVGENEAACAEVTLKQRSGKLTSRSEVGFVLEVSPTARRHKIVILMVVNSGKMRMKGE